MNNMSTTRKLLLLALFGTIALVGCAALLAYLHGAHEWEPTLVLFDHDMSGTVTVAGWMIAIPAMLIAFVIVLTVLTGVGILLALLCVLALAVALCAVVVGLSFVIVPVAAFLAVPALIVWALIRANQRRGAAIAAAQSTHY
jgi:hypothetical protein